jgi:hypothetical protein
MVNYNQKLDKLFATWESDSGTEGKKLFHCDGIMHKGESTRSKSGYWSRERANEDQLWHNAPRRILFLMKEPNGNPGEDIREWNGIGRHGTKIGGNFFTNLSIWLYGLSSIELDGKYPSFSKANEYRTWSTAFENLPLAIVNVKKESGGSTVSNDVLLDYNTKENGKNAKYLRKELEILKPRIIVCGGGSGTILWIVKNLAYRGVQFAKINPRIHFNEGRGLVLIDSYHPSAWTIESKEMYEEIMKSFKDFLKGSQRKTGVH